MPELTGDERRILAAYANCEGVALLRDILAPLNPVPNLNQPRRGGKTLAQSRWLDRENALVRVVDGLVGRVLLAPAPVVTREDLDRHDRHVITDAGRAALAATPEMED